MSEQLDWRQAAAARGLKVIDLAEHVGTSIEGIDLGDEHDAEMVAIIRAACVERTLLLFRGQQQPEPGALLAFARPFGGRAGSALAPPLLPGRPSRDLCRRQCA